MKLKIRLFATLKDRIGSDHVHIELPDSSTVEQMLAAVAADYPKLAPALPTALVAINKAFASIHTPIEAGDEVALFPPVSGGQFPHPTYFAISEEAPDVQAIHAHLTQPDVGAVVTFTGSVRGETQRDGLPSETIYLEYESYSEMAEMKMAQIAHEIWQRWPLVKGIAIVQRVGKLEIGEMTTFVACASGHRDQGGFEAARYGIDRLKEIVPVWKKEVSRDKSVWVEGDYQPTEKDNLETRE